MSKSESLTFTYPALVNVVHSPCFVSVGFDLANPPDPRPPSIQFHAIWDTGATASVITQEVVDRLGLVATGMTKVHGFDGETTAEVYVVNIALMQDVEFPGATVTKGKIIGGPCVLIGMDIIGKGDFAITNSNGKTTMSYRYPSQMTIDFVQQHRARQQQDALLARSQHHPGGFHRPKSKKKKH